MLVETPGTAAPASAADAHCDPLAACTKAARGALSVAKHGMLTLMNRNKTN